MKFGDVLRKRGLRCRKLSICHARGLLERLKRLLSCLLIRRILSGQIRMRWLASFCAIRAKRHFVLYEAGQESSMLGNQSCAER